MRESKCTPKYGTTNPTPEQFATMPIKRFGSVIGLNADKEQYYRELHANVWPDVIQAIKRANIQNYSIYVTEIEGKKYLFSYMEYVGNNFDADMQTIADDPITKKWWKETDPCQRQLPNRKPGANWSDMEMVFLCE
ncbi:MAG: L-rhamnose mutarotase [Kiritimatiellae bacterium]|jgi:L-rhamnose mutarotase|nr:L-rhamnose mutarotase [Kiritimatiellia bacterium]